MYDAHTNTSQSKDRHCKYDTHTMQGQFTYDAHTSTPGKDRPVVYMMLIRCKDNSHMMPIQTHPKVRTDIVYMMLILCKDNTCMMSIQTHPKVNVNTIFILTYITYWLWAGLSSPFSVPSFPPLPC